MTFGQGARLMAMANTGASRVWAFAAAALIGASVGIVGMGSRDMVPRSEYRQDVEAVKRERQEEMREIRATLADMSRKLTRVETQVEDIGRRLPAARYGSGFNPGPGAES